MATMNISLPAKMKEWIETQLVDGRYANTSDYVRDLVRRDQQRAEGIARLQAEIDKGRASGVSDTPVDELLGKIRKKTKAALKARDAA